MVKADDNRYKHSDLAALQWGEGGICYATDELDTLVTLISYYGRSDKNEINHIYIKYWKYSGVCTITGKTTYEKMG